MQLLGLNFLETNLLEKIQTDICIENFHQGETCIHESIPHCYSDMDQLFHKSLDLSLLLWFEKLKRHNRI